MKSFLNACGLSGPFLLTAEGPGIKGMETHSLQQPYAVIGRDPRADISFEDDNLSRRHVYIQVVEGRAFWVDLESRAGTRGSEGAEQKSGWLESDRQISIGPFMIGRPAPTNSPRSEPRRALTARESPLLALSYGRTPLPNVALEFLNGPTRGELWPMHRVMSLIGSSKGCKFRLTDRSVAPFHASLIRTSSGLWIIDLRGAGSIIVNETTIRCVRLTDGDTLSIGRYRIRVRYQMWERTTRDRPAVPMPDSRTPRRATPPGSELSLIDHSSSALAYEPGPSSFPGSPIAMPAHLEPSTVPGVQMVPLEATFPTRIDESAMTQSILVPLVNQFSMMQQQMFDQFQQSMGMLVQMFSTMHRDQMEVIHEELGRLKELTSELHSLRIELGNRPLQEANTSPPADSSAASSVPDLDEIERMLANTKKAPPSTLQTTSPVPPVAPPHSASVTPVPDPILTPEQVAAITGISSLLNFEVSPSAARPTPQQATGAAPTGRAATNPDPAAVRPQQTDSASAGPEDSNSVAWLHKRIVTLQRERETRWKTILKLLPGNS